MEVVIWISFLLLASDWFFEQMLHEYFSFNLFVSFLFVLSVMSLPNPFHFLFAYFTNVAKLQYVH